MTAEAKTIPEWAMKAAREAYEKPVRDDSSLVSIVSRDASDDVLSCLATAIHDAVMAERGSLFDALVAAYKRGAEWQWQNSQSDEMRLGVAEGVGKAAYDYADKATSPAAPKAEG